MTFDENQIELYERLKDSSGEWIVDESGQTLNRKHASPLKVRVGDLDKTFYLHPLKSSKRVDDTLLKFTVESPDGSKSHDYYHKMTLFRLDADVDSTNTGHISPDNEEIDQMEETSPGCIMQPTDGDADGDGVIDYADFNIAGEALFKELKIRVPKALGPEDSRVSLQYAASAPPLTEGGSLAGGSMRIWKKQSNEQRNPQPVTEGGDYVAPGNYTYDQLGIVDGEVTLYAEMVRTGSEMITVGAGPTGQPSRYQDRVRVSAYRLKLWIDSDNNGYGMPDRSWEEETLKNREDHPGKIIPINNQDADGDRILDYADGFDVDFSILQQTDGASGSFVPMILEIPSEIDRDNATLKFTYSSSDPAQVSISGLGLLEFPYEYSLPAGKLRLWTKNGGSARNKASVTVGGDFIPSDVEIKVADLFAENSSEITLFVEAIEVSGSPGDISVKVELDNWIERSYTLKDEIKCTNLLVILDRFLIHKDSSGNINTSGIQIGHTAKYQSVIAPIDLPEEYIKWSIAGPVEFSDGSTETTGKTVYVKGLELGDFTLSMDLGRGSCNPRISGKVLEPKRSKRLFSSFGMITGITHPTRLIKSMYFLLKQINFMNRWL